MTQFQVYRLTGGQLVLDLQTDLVQTGARVVAPLFRQAERPAAFTRLEPVLEIDGEPHVLRTGELAAVPEALVGGAPVADLTARDYEIRGALDMLFSGF